MTRLLRQREAHELSALEIQPPQLSRGPGQLLLEVELDCRFLAELHVDRSQLLEEVRWRVGRSVSVDGAQRDRDQADGRADPLFRPGVYDASNTTKRVT